MLFALVGFVAIGTANAQCQKSAAKSTDAKATTVSAKADKKECAKTCKAKKATEMNACVKEGPTKEAGT